MKDFEYHTKQYSEPKRSTVMFADWLNNNISMDKKRIIDIACGGGGCTSFLGRRFPSSNFLGIDYDEEFLALAKNDLPNVNFEWGDLYHLPEKYCNAFDGVVCLQTISWLSDYKVPIQKICELNPDWIALTGLFYEGRINFYTRIEDYERGDEGWGQDGERYYNVYSLPIVKDYFTKWGYSKFTFKKFEIDIDLPKPQQPRMATYTEKMNDGRRLQISGGLLMPWYFVLAYK